MKAQPVAITSARDKMPFEVTPFFPRLTRYNRDQPAAPQRSSDNGRNHGSTPRLPQPTRVGSQVDGSAGRDRKKFRAPSLCLFGAPEFQVSAAPQKPLWAAFSFLPNPGKLVRMMPFARFAQLIPRRIGRMIRFRSAERFVCPAIRGSYAHVIQGLFAVLCSFGGDFCAALAQYRRTASSSISRRTESRSTFK